MHILASQGIVIDTPVLHAPEFYYRFRALFAETFIKQTKTNFHKTHIIMEKVLLKIEIAIYWIQIENSRPEVKNLIQSLF